MLSLPPRPRHVAATALALLALGACARHEPLPPAVVVLAPVYCCYRTLADVSCYTAPDPRREGRFLGAYLRDPCDPGWPDYWLRRAGAWPP